LNPELEIYQRTNNLATQRQEAKQSGGR